ncbi:MAG TPA: 30S ribosomal protein THX [Sphingobacteriaceae bacterium]|nr:30S ribosomal protein THX [Sphingobacteriaceae bacterium]
MGKGDKKSKKGKITIGSFGKKRPHKKSTVKATTVDSTKESKE